MKVGIVATHSFPIPHASHTGDVVIVDLAWSLAEMGHTVRLYAPEGTVCSGCEVLPFAGSMGRPQPSVEMCEAEYLDRYADSLRSNDIVHDFSITKTVSRTLRREGRPVISTQMGGAWRLSEPPPNLVAFSEAQRGRLMRGYDDYAFSPLATGQPSPQVPVRDCHVVYGGVDTDWYKPFKYEKDSYFLWLNRWHPAKGCEQAIEFARATGLSVVIAGEHPDNYLSNGMAASERDYGLAMELRSRSLSNVTFQWLPPDPWHHEAKREVYRQAFALLYPVQFQEPFGLGQVEAMACGTPVLGIGLGSVPEVVEDSVTGYVGENLVDLAEKAVAIDPKRCRDRAVERFDRRVMAKAYVQEYLQTLEGQIWS